MNSSLQDVVFVLVCTPALHEVQIELKISQKRIVEQNFVLDVKYRQSSFYMKYFTKAFIYWNIIKINVSVLYMVSSLLIVFVNSVIYNLAVQHICC